MAEHSDLAEVRAGIERGGARKYHESAAAAGKLFARERIRLLTDEDSFTEDGRYANVLTALELGVCDFDASVGGLGGCPYAPGATGNIATEELVHMVEDMGVATGIDLEAMIEAAADAERIIGRPLPSQVLRAGPRTRTIPT